MDLTGYRLVFADDFDGTSLDLEKWDYRHTGPENCGFNAPSQVRVENGNLILRCYYRTDGEFGEGWSGADLHLRERYLRGYFEIRAICSDPYPTGFWSAFWLQARGPYTPSISRGGPGGAEIDIIESGRGRDRTPDYPGSPGVDANIHVTGMQKPPYTFAGHTTEHPYPIRVDIPDCFTAYHTYALEWTEEVYRFFVDGRMVSETSWGDGVSEVDEEVCISMCIPGNAPADKTQMSEFFVDYLRIYQKD